MNCELVVNALQCIDQITWGWLVIGMFICGFGTLLFVYLVLLLLLLLSQKGENEKPKRSSKNRSSYRGGKKSLSIAQIKEVIKILCWLMYEDSMLVAAMIKNGEKQK